MYLDLVLFLKSLSFFTDSFLGLQTSGGRGLGLSRVSQQDLDMVGKSLQLAVLFGWHSLAQVVCSWHDICLMASPVCVSAAKERVGCQFWRGSTEEAAGGGGIVQSSSLPIHFHPGPCSQDQRTAQTAKKLIWECIYKDWKTNEYFALNEKCCQEGGKTENETTRHFTLCNSFLYSPRMLG